MLAVLLVAALLGVILGSCSAAGSSGDDASGQQTAPQADDGASASNDDVEAASSAPSTASASSSLVPDVTLSLGDDNALVVALDPGHGAEDGGADDNGLTEKDLCWTIAGYCAAYLEEHGVQVVLTRAEDENPDLSDRAQVAADAGADVLVSIHINSNDEDSSLRGATVYYPTEKTSYLRAETATAGHVLARYILAGLVGLGLENNGATDNPTTVDLSDPNELEKLAYSGDTSGVSDYYGVIRGARKLGIPGLIVEHAFQSNPDDAAMLAMDSFLRALGEADAKAILAAYGLS